MTNSRANTIYEALGREPIHPFPARMAPDIAIDILNQAKYPIRVLDPMMGSGTVLALARSLGHRAIGIDIDPLSVLLSKVWTTSINFEHVQETAVKVLYRAKSIFDGMLAREAYPWNADEETKRFAAYWFDSYARRQLASLALVISRVRDQNTQDALWCAFSRLIISKQAGASLAMDLSHSRPHRSFLRAPGKPFKNFLTAIEHVARNCINEASPNRGPASYTRCGDARHLPMADASIDLVLTSPPYLNAIDYMRCSKFSLVWMGYSIGQLRQLRSNSIGAESAGKRSAAQETRAMMAEMKLRPKLSAREAAILLRYIGDMQGSLREASRVLVPGGKATYVVGDNTIRGTRVRNSFIVAALAELSGLKLASRRIRHLPANRRYLPPPLSTEGLAALDTRMRHEVILSFVKPEK